MALEPALSFLVVDDDPVITRSVTRQLRRDGVVHVAHTAKDAHALLVAFPLWGGACIDLLLPDGSGLDLVARVRRQCPLAPVMVLTGWIDPDVINKVHALGAAYVAKPITTENTRRFIDEARKAARSTIAGIPEAVSQVVPTWGLSPRESETLTLAVQGLPRREIAERMGVQPETVKTYTKSILAKTGCLSVREVVQQLFAPLDKKRT